MWIEYGWSSEVMVYVAVVTNEQHRGNSNCKDRRAGWLLLIALKALKKQLITFIMFSESL